MLAKAGQMEQGATTSKQMQRQKLNFRFMAKTVSQYDWLRGGGRQAKWNEEAPPIRSGRYCGEEQETTSWREIWEEGRAERMRVKPRS